MSIEGAVPGVKVAQLTSVHPVQDTRIFVKQCPSLAAAGYDVVLIACSNDAVSDASFRITTLKRFKSRAARMMISSTQMLKAAIGSKASIVHFHDPELLIVGLILRALGRSVIYDVHEDYKESIRIRHWIPSSLRSIVASFFDLFERLASRFMTANVAATPAIARRLPTNNTVIVQNFPVVEEFRSIGLEDYEQRAPNLVYVGAFSRERGILELVQSLPMIVAVLPRARLLLAGSFDDRELEGQVCAEDGWAYVDYRGWLQRREVADLLAAARVGVVALHPVGNYIEAYPVKLFEYMAAGLPVIASDFPLNRQLVTGHSCGILVDPRSHEELAAAAIRLLEDPASAKRYGIAGRNAVVEEFSWDNERRKLLALYARIAEERLSKHGS